MSKFLDELKNALDGCDFTDETGVDDLINSLGENAKRMLDIGICQDKLVKLGFEYECRDSEMQLYWLCSMEYTKKHHYKSVIFWHDHVHFYGENFHYTSPTWQEDLLAFMGMIFVITQKRI